MAFTAVVTFVVALAGINARATYGAQVTADEPQYLITAISLAEDVDLDISDELAEERFRPFHEIRLNQQTIDLNDSGQRLSPHDPLLPLLLAPAMAIGGWVAAKAALAMLAAATAAASLWVAVRRFGVSVGVATAVVTALFVAPPLTSYGTQVYPEMPAALALIVGVAAVTSPRLSTRSQAVAALTVIALPWLAVKYAPVAAVVAVAMLLRLGRSGHRARLLGWSAGLAVAGAVYLLFHQRVYGGWTVYAAGDHFVDGELEVVGRNPDYAGRSRRLIGLLVDRHFGLIPWAPVYLLTVPAVVSFVRRRLDGWPVLVAGVGVGWAMATWVALTMHGWWWPGRQLVVVLPLVVVAMAVFADRHRRLVPALVIASLLGTASWLWLVVEASTGRHTLIVDFHQTANPWYRLWAELFPAHTRMAASDVVLTAGWTLALLTLGAMAWRATPRSRSERG